MAMCVAQSFSKNFGLYGQRAGAFHFVAPGLAPTSNLRIRQHLANLIRSEFSMAPRTGSTLVKTVLEDEELRGQWLKDLKVMSGRIKHMRTALYEELVRLGTPGTWEHIVNQVSKHSFPSLLHSGSIC